MRRLAPFDVTRPFQSRPVQLAAQVLFGIGCAGLFWTARLLVDAFSPGAGPFALIFPPILIATLFAHWQAGVFTFALTFLYAWHQLIQPVGSWSVASHQEQVRVIANGASALLIIFLAEAFRRAVRAADATRDEEIERSEILRRELDHRTKNNFQLMQSLLQLQRRREEHPAAKEALSLAGRRLASFTSIYASLPIAPSAGENVPIKPYLEAIVRDVTAAIFDKNVAVSCEIAAVELPRQTAVAIGLYANEALTNCAKHAFNPGQDGSVRVQFSQTLDGWRLIISDDGRGTKKDGDGGGIGAGLMHAFAKQAGAIHRAAFRGAGCRVELSSVPQNPEFV